jgi:hypothetical protein
VFERSVQRKEDKRRVDVGEHEDDGEGAVEKEADGLFGDVKILEKTVENAVGAENGFPGVSANEIADPERNDDELIEELPPGAGFEGHEIGQRIAEEQGEEGDTRGDAHGAEKDFEINGIMEELGVVLKIPFVNEEAIANEPETVGEHQGIRKKKEQADPQEWRQGDDRFVGTGVHRSFKLSVLSCT